MDTQINLDLEVAVKSKLEYVHKTKMYADVFTKALEGLNFSYFLNA
jgi:hypothetical protein